MVVTEGPAARERGRLAWVWHGLVGVAVVAALQAGCARPRPAHPDPWATRVSAADTAAAAGCYRCLEAALRGYEELLAVRPDQAVGERAFRVAVQLAVRERLLGLFPGSYQDGPARLRAHANAGDAAAADDVLAAMRWRRGTLGLGVHGDKPIDVVRMRARRIALEPLADADAWHATLLLALVGTNPWVAAEEGQRAPTISSTGLDHETWWARHPGDGALSFMRLTLLRSSLDDWAVFQAARPDFVESWAIVAEGELARGRLVSADEAFATALLEFPSLVPALALRGDLRQRMEDFATAVTLYDTLLQRLPDHREALLGRLMSLGFAGRHEDALAAADRMLALGTWYLGEAHYWKAWNLFNLRRLDEARASVDQARTLLVNADVSYLGGVIAFRQERQDDALRDFDAALDLESRHCEAHFDRAALLLVRRTWRPASSGFDEAHACHTARTARYEQRIADAREARLPDEAREALVARREVALRDHRHQLAWARYNAAVAYANLAQETTAQARVDEALAIGGPAADAARDLLVQLRRR